MKTILFGAFAAAALACGSDAEPDDVPYELTGPFAVHDALSADPSPGALLTGTLALQDGCLYACRPNGTVWVGSQLVPQ